MSAENRNQVDIFKNARAIIEKDETIPQAEKESVLKLIQVLVEASQSSPPRNKDNQVRSFTQEIISRHALMTMVKQQADELDALRRLSLNLTSSLDLQTVLDAVVDEAMRLVKNAFAAHIFLYVNGKLEFGASLNSENVRNKPLSLPRPEGLTYAVVNHGKQIMVEDISDHELYRNAHIKWVGSIIGIPLKINDSIVGVMNLSRTVTGPFTRSELRLLGLLADQAAVAISNASLHKHVAEQANTDAVTGLPNRRALDERIEDEIRYARRIKTAQFAIVMMDLDGFKAVNDTYGHAMGDDILNSAFNYLAKGIRSTDFLARYGGDELTLVMHEAGLEAAENVTKKIIAQMASYSFPAPGNKKNIKLGITAGISVYPLHARNAGDLLRAADAALYDAKKHNRGSFNVAKGITGPLGAVTLMRRRTDHNIDESL